MPEPAIRRIFAIVFPLLRLLLALSLVYFCAVYWWAERTRAQFAALPDYDYYAGADAQRETKHFGEALLIVDTGLQATQVEKQEELLALKSRIEVERDDMLHALHEVGRGALTGHGDTGAALTGAIITDLLVIGDVRDLAQQGARALRGEDTDAVIITLSGIGLVTTLAPELDWGISLLKFARKAGALGEAFAKNLFKVARHSLVARDFGPIKEIASDASRLAQRARPAGAIRIFKLIDDPATLHRVADFVEQPGGAFALWIGGEPAVSWLKAADREGEVWLLRAGAKGEAGVTFLARKSTWLLRVHPLLGLIKGIYKGNIPTALSMLLERYANVLFGLAFAWLLFEAMLLHSRLRRWRQRAAA